MFMLPNFRLLIHEMDLRGLSTPDALQRLLQEIHHIIEEDKLQDARRSK